MFTLRSQFSVISCILKVFDKTKLTSSVPRLHHLSSIICLAQQTQYLISSCIINVMLPGLDAEFKTFNRNQT